MKYPIPKPIRKIIATVAPDRTLQNELRPTGQILEAKLPKTLLPQNQAAHLSGLCLTYAEPYIRMKSTILRGFVLPLDDAG